VRDIRRTKGGAPVSLLNLGEGLGMTDGDRVHEMSRAVGALEATVKSLTQIWQQQDESATEGRHRLYAKVDQMMTELVKLTGRVDRLAEEVTTLKPQVATFNDNHQQGIGSKRTIALAWTMFVGMIGSMTAGVVELIHYLIGKH
jgi:hypothetical protein